MATKNWKEIASNEVRNGMQAQNTSNTKTGDREAYQREWQNAERAADEARRRSGK